MKIPLEWLKEYIDITKSPREIADSFTALGLMLDKPIENGVLDLEHRMDRSDWLAVVGCARDLAAMEELPLKYPKLHKEPGKQPTEQQKIKIEVQCPDLVKRFNTRTFRNVTVKPSPDWLKNRLEAYGIPSINNIVDITNYVMVELGQPMHAQDIDKLEKPEIIIRKARNGEKIKTLLGETVELNEQIFVLTQNDKPTVIGGIVGGESTGVTLSTKNIVLDAGNYNQNNVRKSSRMLKIQNETVLRYDKFLHPMLTQIAIERATQLILDLAGGEYFQNEDYYPTTWPLKQMPIRLSRIKQVSGMDFELRQVIKILTALEYKVLEERPESLILEVPYFRTDVDVEDDLVADVLRIYNYANIKPAQIQASPPKEITPEIYKFEQKIRDALVSAGLQEHITNPMVKADGSPHQVILQNSLNSEKDSLRTSIYQTLQDVIVSYKKQGHKEARIFEVGKIYTQTGKNHEDFKEINTTEIIYYSDQTPFDLNKALKSIISRFLLNLGISPSLATYKPKQDAVTISIGEIEIGELRYDSATFYNMALLQVKKANLRVKSGYKNNINEDITIELSIGDNAGNLYSNLVNQKHPLVEKIVVVNEFKKTDQTKAITFRITFSPKEGNTLTLEQVQQAKQQLTSNM